MVHKIKEEEKEECDRRKKELSRESKERERIEKVGDERWEVVNSTHVKREKG